MACWSGGITTAFDCIPLLKRRPFIIPYARAFAHDIVCLAGIGWRRPGSRAIMEFGTFLIIAATVLLIVVVGMRSNRRNAAWMDHRSCRACGAGHPPFAQYCRRCGQRLA
jgi:ribosomal protein L40E